MALIETIKQRNPLPEGTLSVGIGLAITGLTSMAYLLVSKRVLGDEAFTPLGNLWFLVFMFGGVFVPFEQEIGRRLAALRVRGEGGGPVIRRVVALAGGMVVLLVVVTALLAPVLLDRLFDGQVLLVVGLVLGAVGLLTANVSQGILAGNDRFGRYGAFLGTDSSLRLTIALVLMALGVRVAGPIGLALGIGPLVTALVLLWGRRELMEPGPELPWRDLTAGLGALLAASAFSQILINASPILVNLYAGPDSTAGAVFISALIVARVPLFVFQAVQAALLPRLARLAAAGQLDEFRSGISRLVVLVGGLVVVGSVVIFAIGPTLVSMFEGGDVAVDRMTVGLLAAASGGFLIATALSLGLIALHGARLAAVGWFVGVVTLLGVSALLDTDPVSRVTVAFAASTFVAAAVMGALLVLLLRRGAVLAPDDVLDALNDIALDI
jgi:O-antigen/teichoic acid export membrane protein